MIKAILKSLRLHHWSKNLLILLPCLAGRHIDSLESSTLLVAGILIFSIAASGTYLVNDLLDRENDTLHFHKKNRPIASGELPVPVASSVAALLLLGSLLGAFLINLNFAYILVIYLAITFGYSLFFKRLFGVDLILLSSLYLIRIVVGLALSDAYATFWLFAFTGSFFLSLAALKRFTEIQDRKELGESKLHGRGYTADHGNHMKWIGLSSAIVAVTMLACYVFSPAVSELYSHSQALLILVLALCYWLGHAWWLAHKKKMHSDPIVFAIKEPLSYLIAIICLGALWLAR